MSRWPGRAPSPNTVSKLASRHRKVAGGQGGDEIFGGYARYLIAYFEQCIKAAIDGTTQSGNFIVTYESIIPNLSSLREYKPLLQEFWRKGLFEDLDRRYFRLINRARDVGDEVDWRAMERFTLRRVQSDLSRRQREEGIIFRSHDGSDFKTLLPALLHVEDRMEYAHA
ncbi:MAG: asparagine synthase-related protein [Nitrospiraceae bacterium]